MQLISWIWLFHKIQPELPGLLFVIIELLDAWLKNRATKISVCERRERKCCCRDSFSTVFQIKQTLVLVFQNFAVEALEEHL